MMSSVNYHNITSRPSVAMETNQGVPPSTVAPSTVATHLAPSLPPSYHAPVVRRGSRDLDSEFRRNGNQYRFVIVVFIVQEKSKFGKKLIV